MTFDLFVELAWKSLLAAGCALLVLLITKHRSAAERSWIAHAGLVATLLLPFAALLLPRWHVGTELSATALPIPASGPSSAATAPAAAPGIPEFAPLLNLELLVWLYLAVAAILLLATLIAVARLSILLGRASVLVEQPWLSALAHAQRRMGFKHGTALLVTDEIASPVSWGVVRPIILLNREAVALHAQAEAIIAHELAHVARLDWAKLLIARLATALFWFNPLVWVLARQCHQLREEAADDAVLESNVPGADYASLLVGAARHECNAMLLAAHGVAPGRDSLKRRVARALAQDMRRVPVRAPWALGCSALALSLAAPLSAISLAPPPSSPEELAAADGSSAPAAAQAPFRARPSHAESPEPVAIEAKTGVATAQASLPAIATASSVSSVASAAGRTLTAAELKMLQDHDVTADFIREVRAAGYPQVTPDQLMRMRDQGMTAPWLRDMAAAGRGRFSVEDLITLRIQDMPPSYARRMAAAGASFSADELLSMYHQRISPDTPEAWNEAGGAARALPPDD